MKACNTQSSLFILWFKNTILIRLVSPTFNLTRYIGHCSLATLFRFLLSCISTIVCSHQTYWSLLACDSLSFPPFLYLYHRLLSPDISVTARSRLCFLSSFPVSLPSFALTRHIGHCSLATLFPFLLFCTFTTVFSHQTYRSLLACDSVSFPVSLPSFSCQVYSSTLTMDAVGSSETSVHIYHFALLIAQISVVVINSSEPSVCRTEACSLNETMYISFSCYEIGSFVARKPSLALCHSCAGRLCERWLNRTCISAAPVGHPQSKLVIFKATNPINQSGNSMYHLIYHLKTVHFTHLLYYSMILII
jgi:hypothetical protein